MINMLMEVFIYDKCSKMNTVHTFTEFQWPIGIYIFDNGCSLPLTLPFTFQIAKVIFILFDS